MAQHLHHRPYQKMPVSKNQTLALLRHNMSVKVMLSYVFDWVVLIAVGIVSTILGTIEPHKRPFSLTDPNISFPYHEHEAVPLWLLAILIGAFPLLTIFIVTLVFVPGATVPRHTPAALIWKRKAWELHICTMGLVTAHILAFFFTQGMKNLFGKPRPDLLDRCQPDMDNAMKHAIGGFAGETMAGQLFSASICTQEDEDILWDGFRSYPSGHSSGSAAGLVYTSLFLASKFAVVIPFALPGASSKAIAHAAFPSRMAADDALRNDSDGSEVDSPMTSKPVNGQQASHNAKLQSLRNQAAAPPLYLLAIVLAPFALSVYISASRWFDFRHHGFDILFGYLMGFISAVYAFRYYHLPIQEGAGWAWGPRSNDRAFWAGVGRLGYTSQPIEEAVTSAEVDKGHRMGSNDVDYGREDASAPGYLSQRPTGLSESSAGAYGSQAYGNTAYASNVYAPSGHHNPYAGAGVHDNYSDVEMQRMDNRI